MFIFNFQNLGLLTLNLIKKKTVDIIILLNSLLIPSCHCQQLSSIDWGSSQLCCWRNLWTFPKMDSLSYGFRSVIFFINFTNIWQNTKLKNIMYIIFILFSKLADAITQRWNTNNENKNSTCSRFTCGFINGSWKPK